MKTGLVVTLSVLAVGTAVYFYFIKKSADGTTAFTRLDRKLNLLDKTDAIG